MTENGAFPCPPPSSKKLFFPAEKFKNQKNIAHLPHFVAFHLREGPFNKPHLTDKVYLFLVDNLLSI